MDPADFSTFAPGKLVPTIFGQMAFVPAPLPPQIDLGPVQRLLSEADQKLGELRGIGRYLPNPYLLIRPLQRREAIASSNIEGTYTSLRQLLLFESGVEDEQGAMDAQEVLNYIHALQQGIAQLQELPISNRLICRLHETLLSHLPARRAGHQPPGEYRTQQNFIGRTRDISRSRYNPPPPTLHLECMGELERYINRDDPGLPLLVFMSLVHYQFEAIHPFPDGNGRVGRILLPLILHGRGAMNQPLLYMSQFFEDNRDEYVDLLLRVSLAGDWASWIRFFINAVVASCDKTIDTIERVRTLQDSYRERCQQARSSALLTQIVDSLFERGVTTVPIVRAMTGLSYTAAHNNVARLVDLGILTESNVPARPKRYFASELNRIFER